MLFDPPPPVTNSHLLGPPPPSSVTYFMDGPKIPMFHCEMRLQILFLQSRHTLVTLQTHRFRIRQSWCNINKYFRVQSSLKFSESNFVISFSLPDKPWTLCLRSISTDNRLIL